MTTTEDKPVDRDAWRRLLDGDGEAPPELTDARIRARARQAIAPRTGRWWLPASLAASLLLAVVLVQRQYDGTGPRAVVTEADYSAAPAAERPAPFPQDELRRDAAPASPRQETQQANESNAAVANRRVAASKPDSEGARTDGFEAPRPVPPPMVDLPVMSEAPATSAAPAEEPAADSSAVAAPAAEAKREDKKLGEIMVTGSRARTGSLESSTPVTQVTAADVGTQGVAHAGGLLKEGVAERTPEEWYAEIEKLRAAGKKREAKRELEKLRKAHPGWLEENYPKER